MIQAGLYLGYGLGHDILGYYVNNHNELTNEEIKKGVTGFLQMLVYLCAGSLVCVLISLPNKPVGSQIVFVNTGANPRVKSADANNKSAEESLIVADEADATPQEKPSFWAQFKLLVKDKIYMVLVFGVLLGSNTIGGQNVSMAVMLKTFGIPEVGWCNLVQNSGSS